VLRRGAMADERTSRMIDLLVYVLWGTVILTIFRYAI
jgi:hypothetical protein